MSHSLVYYGNETLASVAERVENVDGEIAALVNEMFDIMYKERGIGLAAPQIDVGKRVIVIDTGEEVNGKLALINPEIIEVSDNLEPYEEGCLSVPRLLADVVRPAEILVKGISVKGSEVTLEASGLMARVLQHEVDHLDGILFIDRIEKYIRDEFRAELKKIKKLNKK
ncbi:MAG: peptide deformylase [Spirochaetae bacterium HGW-Spirochaetae-5]|nr:MAG: peptide deformylase [Spirochaetae bacterium HGW-Spirochaetae-5]